MDFSTHFINIQMKIPLHKIPVDVKCKTLLRCHIALKFIGFIFLRILFTVRKFIKWYFRYDIYQIIDWWTTLARISVARTNALSLRIYEIHIGYAISDITIKNCAYFWAFLNTDSVGRISTDAEGKLVKIFVHVYDMFWLREITKSSVMLADTWRDANRYHAFPLS